jgi:hypothetical protein
MMSAGGAQALPAVLLVPPPMPSALPNRPMQRLGRLLLAAATLGLASTAAQAWILTVTPGSRALYLQVGAGTNNGNNATINQVSLTVPAAQVGTGTLAMTSNSTVSNSFFDGFAVCNPPQQVYIGAWYRIPGNSGAGATLRVSTPSVLTSGTDTISFTSISWLSTANQDSTAHIPSGTFTGGSQLLRTIAVNTWVENCLVFSYANATVPAAGTYTGRATYTISAP